MPGYRDPPIEHRFKPGQSGNPKGGPRGPRKNKLHAATGFLDQVIKCRIGGKRFAGTRGEALMRVASRMAIEKKIYVIQQLLLKLKEQLDQAQSHIDPDKPTYIIHDWPDQPNWVSCIEDAADVSGFGKKAYLKQKTGRVLLENWVVEEAFANLGDRHLDREQQKLVLEAVRFPKKMKWPEWWDKDLRQRGKGWRAAQNAEISRAAKAPTVIRRSLTDQLAIDHNRERLLQQRDIEQACREDPVFAPLAIPHADPGGDGQGPC